MSAKEESCATSCYIGRRATKFAALLEALGYNTELIDSPITGAEGNKEFLLHAHR